MLVPTVAISDADISKCFEVVLELRPHLTAGTFVSLVRKMEAEGYRLAFIEDENTVVSVAGFRISTSLFMGKNLYVDDLITTGNSRSKGYGKVMLDWLGNLAEESACTHVHLDSGTQRHRAHRFYLRQGMDIASFHFSQKLDEG